MMTSMKRWLQFSFTILLSNFYWKEILEVSEFSSFEESSYLDYLNSPESYESILIYRQTSESSSKKEEEEK